MKSCKKLNINSINLLNINTDKVFRNKNLDLILNDDIWEKDILLIKKGKYLSEELIKKLINFGIREVNVNIAQKNVEGHETVLCQEDIENNKELKEFIQDQKALIVENNNFNKAWVSTKMIGMGFRKENLYITCSANSINQYFRSQKINFIFIGYSLYKNCIKCINKYSLLRNTHVFVFLEKKDIFNIENNYNSRIKFLRRPLSRKTLYTYIYSALNFNFLEKVSEETDISKIS